MELKIAFLIPVYNEERNISSLIRKIPAEPCDIIIVDDGSKDRTVEKIKKEGVILLGHSKNMGKGMAHKTGFKYVVNQNYDYVITLDGDGQHPPKEAIKFIKRIKDYKEDILIGTRYFSPKTMPIVRFLTNYTTSFIVSLLAHKRIRDSQSGYRAISTDVLKDIKLTTSRFQTESELLIKAGRAGKRIESVPITTIYKEEVSKIAPIPDTLRFIALVLRSLWT